MPKISQLNQTAFPSLEHELAAAKDNETVKITVGQIRALMEFKAAELTASLLEAGDTTVQAFLENLRTGKVDTSDYNAALLSIGNSFSSVNDDIDSLAASVIRTDTSQSFSIAEQGQARANIGAGTFRWNWTTNGDFTINQREGVKKPANGVYGYDRWKGHANGIEQVVEALPAGEYTLTWSGGGTGVFGGINAVSPIKATVSAGNTSVVVPQTATKVSLVEGDATAEANPYSPRPIQLEEALCQRYYEVFSGVGITGYQQAGNGLVVPASFKVVKRVLPTTGINSWGTANNVSTPVTARTTVNGTEVQTVAVNTGVAYVTGIIGFADAEFY